LFIKGYLINLIAVQKKNHAGFPLFIICGVTR